MGEAQGSASGEGAGGRGLTSYQAEERLRRYGENRLAPEKKAGFVSIFFEEIREPMILLLLVVAVFYSIWGQLRDVITIVVVICLLVLAEVFNEYRAKRAIASLSKLTAPRAPVVRDGRLMEVPSASVVPGDLLLLRVGERVPADAVLETSVGLETDESTLTGESNPVEKDAQAHVPESAPLAERANQVFAGTVVTRGKGTATVTATGMETELGKIAGMTREVREPRTPLQKAMRQLAGWLVWVALAVSIVIPVIGIVQGKPYRVMILTGLALAFATIPEELPIIITMVLGLGAYQLSRQKALVKRLRAAETLGSVTVIATDKTGTLTENRTVLAEMRSDKTKYRPGTRPDATFEKMLEIGYLVNDIEVKQQAGQAEYVGDPLEAALVDAAVKAMVPAGTDARVVDEYSFDRDRKVMSAVVQSRAGRQVYLKGAPEAVLARSERLMLDGAARPLTADRQSEILRDIDAMAAEGMRVLAFAVKDLPAEGDVDRDRAESGLTFLGTAGFQDPPRQDARSAIDDCRNAGIKVLMVTGDHPNTAEAVARAIGLDSVSPVTGSAMKNMSDAELHDVVENRTVFARTTPADKIRIIRALHANDEIVAVTGDGVNDAPALREADIGIAMGRTGTEVAREAADMVLTDDDFATIAFAVKQGRRMFDNLRKGLRYYLSVKVALALIFLVPTFIGMPLPFAPIQIIVLELFMDLAASATFVAEKAEGNVMSRSPRSPRARFMDRTMIGGLVAGGLSLFGAVTLVYLTTYYALGERSMAGTAAFATWMFGTVFLAFNMRSERVPVVAAGLFSNRVLLVWTVLALGFLAVVVNVPALQRAFKVASLSGPQWLFAAGAAFVATSWMEVVKLSLRARSRSRSEPAAA